MGVFFLIISIMPYNGSLFVFLLYFFYLLFLLIFIFFFFFKMFFYLSHISSFCVSLIPFYSYLCWMLSNTYLLQLICLYQEKVWFFMSLFLATAYVYVYLLYLLLHNLYWWLLFQYSCLMSFILKLVLYILMFFFGEAFFFCFFFGILGIYMLWFLACLNHSRHVKYILYYFLLILMHVV